MLENEIYEWLRKRQINGPRYKVFRLQEELDADVYPVGIIFSVDLSTRTISKLKRGRYLWDKNFQLI